MMSLELRESEFVFLLELVEISILSSEYICEGAKRRIKADNIRKTPVLVIVRFHGILCFTPEFWILNIGLSMNIEKTR